MIHLAGPKSSADGNHAESNCGVQAGAEEKLSEVERQLESSRLVAETTLGRERMTEAERTWLRTNSTPEARHWNVLSDLTVEQVAAAL